VRDGGLLISGTFGTGAAGDMNIAANRLVEIKGAVIAAPTVVNVGRGGNLTITSPIIRLIEGGFIAATTIGPGDAGNLEIVASESITVKDRH
jgi:hypothetical protein